MGETSGTWTNLGVHEIGEGLPRPQAVAEAWLRERGIDVALLRDEEIRIDPLCGRDSHGDWLHEYRIMILSAALYRVGPRPESA